MNWLHYLLEANLYLAVFYAGYYLFLSRETYYNLSRAYLLSSSVVSFILPVLQLGILKPVVQPTTALNYTFEPQTGAFTQVAAATHAPPAVTWQDGLFYAYLAGAAILLLVLIVKLLQLIKLTRKNHRSTGADYKLVYLDDSDTAFSFFNFLFIGTKAAGSETIIRHELVHIRQKHSADIVFIELLKIINWFNPFIYMLQYSLKALHEYIADEKTAQAGIDAHAYSSFLVNNAYGLSGSSVTHSFFNYNLLKKRIIMLHQKRSGSLARLKYLLAVPICGGLLCLSTLAFSKTYGWVNIGPHRINKANKSRQVAEPVRRLLVTQHGTSVISDKFSYERPDGSIKYYTVNNLSNKDKEDLKKAGIVVNIISNVTVDTVPPPPPPAPPKPKVTNVVFPAPKPPSAVTKKGYKYAESGYLVNGKTDFRVIIVEKNGDQKAYFKSKASAADKKLLADKYGYTFPAMNIYAKLPPPPPAPPVVVRDKHMPAPPKPPVISTDKRTPAKTYRYLPPVIKKDTAEGHKTHASTTVTRNASGGVLFNPPVNSGDSLANYHKMPVIVVNGEIFKLKQPVKRGQQLLIDAKGGASVVKYDEKELPDAIKKYGENARNGVVFAEGETKISVK